MLYVILKSDQSLWAMETQQPIFQSIFGKSWKKLPPVMHKHYANRPYSEDIVTVSGLMDIKFSWLGRLFSPLFWFFGILVPYQGKQIPVTVQYISNPKNAAYCLNRTFAFPRIKPYIFRSQIEQIKDNELVEFMGLGLGWRMHFIFEDGKVKFKHKGYVIRLFGQLLNIPLEWIFGYGYGEEIALSNDSFSMRMEVKHAIFGIVYQYSGTFTIVGKP